MEDYEIIKLIDEKIAKAMAFATKKYGDTPTDSLQLTPKKYVDANSGVAGGSDTQIQFNDGGAFAGDTKLTWNKTLNYLVVGLSNGIKIDGDNITIKGLSSTQLNIVNGFAGNMLISGGTGSTTSPPTGDLFLQSSSVATTATIGFVSINTCSGTPAGSVLNSTDRAPMIFDSTNKKLYVYSGDWFPMN